MKLTFLSSFILLFSITKGQTSSSIIGSWKMISICSEGIYYNFKNDSISLSEEVRALYPNKSEQQKLCMGLKMIIPANHFHFDSNGIFKQFMDTVLNFEGTYKDLQSQKIIELTTKNSLGQNTTDKLNYVIKNGLLYISMELDEEKFDFVLERINP